MDRDFDVYLIYDVSVRGWNPQPHLNAAPRLIEHGVAAGLYLVVARLQDYPQDFKTWLDANAERVEKLPVDVLYPTWSPAVLVHVGERFAHNGEVYSVIQGHTTQSDWSPANVPALFRKETPDGTIGTWKQPLGGHDTYPKYARVWHNGILWESHVDDNAWEPGGVGTGSLWMKA